MWLASSGSPHAPQPAYLDLVDAADDNCSQDSNDVTSPIVVDASSKWSKFTGDSKTVEKARIAPRAAGKTESEEEAKRVGIDHLVAVSPPKATFATLLSDNESACNTPNTLKSFKTPSPAARKTSHFQPPRQVDWSVDQNRKSTSSNFRRVTPIGAPSQASADAWFIHVHVHV